MSSTLAAGSSWSRSRWAGMITLALVVQLLLVFALSDRRVSTPRAVAAKPVISLILHPGQSARLHRADAVRDPTLFALVNQRGFSGDAWLKPSPREHRSPDWTGPPQLLRAEVNQLGFAVGGAVSSNVAPASAVASKATPRLSVKPLPEPPLTARTTLRVEGGLAGRRIESQPALPALPAAEVLVPTQVEVAIRPDGDLISARLAPGTGVKSAAQKQADQRALELVKAIRFEPVASADVAGNPLAGRLTWGRIVFHWRTLAAKASPPVTPKP